jgi:hypothetical protein
LRQQISDHRLNPINRNLIANGQDYSLVTLDLFVEFNALVAYGNRSSRDRGNPHWLPIDKTAGREICSPKPSVKLGKEVPLAKGHRQPERMRGSTLGIQKGGTRMAHDEKLKPEDFPVHTEQKKIVKNDGKTIADASDKKVAEDVAE